MEGALTGQEVLGRVPGVTARRQSPEIVDAVEAVLPHLHARDVTFVFVSQAPIEKLLAYRRRMGWSFPWVSPAPSGFNFDLGFSHTEEEGREVVEQMMKGGLPPIVDHNARSAGTDAAGYITRAPGSARSCSRTAPSTRRTRRPGAGWSS